MDKVRIGVIGMGNMGCVHADNIMTGKVPRGELTAVCDQNQDRRCRITGLRNYASASEMINSGDVDAVLVATPHYDHTPIGIEALQKGLHVMMEKPISVHKADCEKLLAAHTNKDIKFGAMFNVRTWPVYIRLKQLLDSGEFGAVKRINWIVTTWFRTNFYYASGGWRATWEGEGGGVLLNQCPHNLDLLQWFFGMPKKIHGFCHYGKYHPIEVEDDVTAYLEYKSGATGVLVMSTGEAPGTNRLEIACERGRVIVEDEKIRFDRTEVPVDEFCRTCPQSFAQPPVWEVQIPVEKHTVMGHAPTLANFVDAILDGKPLIAPAEEGIKSVELANAILLSSWKRAPVQLPMDGAEYEAALKEKIAQSEKSKAA